jgi:CHAT domain-containing protein/tetratricopeptide (TPR) repeat protein
MKYVAVLLIFLSFALAWQMYAQKSADTPNGWRLQYERAKSLFDDEAPTAQSDSIALGLFLKVAQQAARSGQFSIAADCYNKGGTIHQTYQRYAEANQLYHQTILLGQKRQCDSAQLYEAYLYIGTSFYYTSIIDSAQHYFEAASGIALGNKSLKLPEKERLYNSLGAIYFESADYLQSKNYFEQALLSIRSSDKDSVDSYVSIKSNIANCLLQLNQPNEALGLYQSLHAVYRLPNVKKIDENLQYTVLHNMAKAYFRLAHYDSALIFYRQIDAYNKGNGAKPKMTTVQMLNDLGRISIYKRQWQMAEAYFDSAAAVCKRVVGSSRNKDRALSYSYRSTLAYKQGLLDEAIAWSNYALQELYVDFEWKKAEDLPVDEVRTISHFAAFDILCSKAALLVVKYENTRKKGFLQAALNTYLLAIRTAGYIKRNFDNDEAKLFFNNNHGQAYYKAIAVANDLLQLGGGTDVVNNYIEIVEGYKGNILYQNQRNIEIKTTAIIADTVKKREKELKHLLALYSTKLSNNRPGDDVKLLQQRLLEWQVELSRIQKLYESDATYNLYKYQATAHRTTVSDIQQYLGKNRALVNFVVADSAIYALAINDKGYVVHKVVADSAFKDTYNGFLGETYDHREGRRYNGFLNGYWLYQQLLQPLATVLNNTAQWIILPDGALNYLPFEAMTTKATGRQYLMLDKTISYHYSVALLSQQQKAPNKVMALADSSIFFAPFVQNDAVVKKSGHAHLPFSAAEKPSGPKLAIMGNGATKQQFLATAQHYQIVHLATHASSGKDSSQMEWIQFYPNDTAEINNRLYTQEIYNLELQHTNLVILSACETAGGQTSSGEGLLSLSRAFLYAGSRGIVSTLWKTEDRVAAYIMHRFHSHFQKSGDAAEALRLSKRDLLNDPAMGPQYKTPNYWANFVYIGQLNDVQSNKGKWIWLLLLLPLLALAVAVYVWANKKSTAQMAVRTH